MRIGELAARAGVTPKTVRYYERRGLLRARRTPSGYRGFEERSVDIISTIRRAQALGVRLSELNDIIALVRDEKLPCANVRELLAAKRRDAAARIDELHAFDRFLARLERAADRSDTPCPILSNVPPRRTGR